MRPQLDAEKDYASVLANAPLHSYRGECTYCGHCKPCPAQLDIAMINKFYDLATMQPEVPATVRSHYEAAGAHRVRVHRLPRLRDAMSLRRAGRGADAENRRTLRLLKIRRCRHGF